MTASVAPSIPPRPVRSQRQPATNDTPKIPPRPARRVERSASPKRDSFARSPLNESTFTICHGDNSSGLYSHGQNLSASNLSLSLPGVALPSVGQEGTEYASFCDGPDEREAAPNAAQSSEIQTRSVGSNLKLHAPKPTLPDPSTKARTATVARTDSTTVAAAGTGHTDDKDPHTRPLKAKTSFTSYDSSPGIERSTSTQPSDSEHGIPEIGLRVPMYPNAGDVQAPSPSPHSTAFSPGIGFHNDGQQRPGRHHKRTLSGRECPPGSYGLHGHGAPNQNKFEKAWYESHPEALEREESGEYGPGLGAARAEWALSSEDLNRVVRETASKGAGYGTFTGRVVISTITNNLTGTSPAIDGTPEEHIGYLASEEYASRITSSNPPSHHRSLSGGSQTHSALRPKEVVGDAPVNRQPSEDVAADEIEDEDVIHVDPLSTSRGDIGTEDLGPQGSNISEHGGWIDEHSYGAPILASDEVAKEPAAERLQPAVSPYQERRSSGYFASGDLERSGSRSSSRPSSTPASRSGSRPNSIIGGVAGFARYSLHDDHEELSTPLEDVEEYEPLFPEDEKGEKPKSAVDRLKRPELSAARSSSSSTRPQRRKFPSQDIWEDAPSSAQLQATVTTPQLADDDQATAKDIGESTESPSGAVASQQHETEDEEASSFLPQETRDWADPKYKDEINNSRQKQRFPSKDIWEDSPESLQLQATVSTPQTDENNDVPSVPGRPTTKAVATAQEKTSNVKEDGVSPTETKVALEKPAPPPRPARSKETAIGGIQPSIPARPPHRVRNLPPADIPPMPAKITAPISSGPQARTVLSPPAKVDGDKIEPMPSPSEKKPPILPERSKPQLPARPAKPITRKSGDSVETSLLKTVSAGSMEGNSATRSGPTPPAAKPKPAVPSRPNGGKLAGLKAGFFSDLDKRLQQGPTAPKPKIEPAEEQAVEEKAPLSDARKGRAKGPMRRKPAASPSGIAEETSGQTNLQKFDISITFTNWQIAEDGIVVVHPAADGASKAPTDSLRKSEINPTPTLATNIAGEKVCLPEDIAAEATNLKYLPDETQDTKRAAEEAQGKLGLASQVSAEGQSAESVTSNRPAEEVQDQDPTFKTAISLNPATTEPPIADKPAALPRESATEPKEVSIAQEHSQTGEHDIYTGTATTKEEHVAAASGKAPEEKDVDSQENTT
ncbi:MAG: hypothetical protein M1839_006203 [Geoglossum umbratile]|nr:MAG: hypothetical protein M1839_006203 [Geoglossum umbratile]